MYRKILAPFVLLFFAFSALYSQNKGDTKKSIYDETITDETVTSKGIVNLHLVKNTLYLEIPLELIGKPMLFAARVAETSNNKDVIAGQMPSNPLLIEWSYDSEKVYLHENISRNICDDEEEISAGYDKNNLTPILRAFPIKCFNNDSSAILFDVTKYYLSDQKPFSPFIPTSPMDGLFGAQRMSGSFKQEMSSIMSVKSFPQNFNVTTRLVFTVSNSPFTAVVTSSMLLLPDEPMRPRHADKRVGYFTDSKRLYTTKETYLKNIGYINRWRLEPKPEDVSKHKQGELVEPAKQIVYYIDPAFPQEWRPFIKRGVEAWQPVFESIGFKNAIIAKDYPDDPEFDPSDLRNSCVIYSPSDFANAMGPSWTDPRSGEIIQGSVYVYHNVLSLLHSWRFIQTATVDPKARTRNYDIDMMGPLLEYLIVHEIGHTIGLMHNMRGSYAFPVDSLRSPHFTQKYGTTTSVMDYARFNYIAQPGDGVKDFMPKIGAYDFFAIKYGYGIFYDAQTLEEEDKLLNTWVTSLASDPIYKYGEQTLFGKDPASQSESLGDDAVKAGRYGINNLKIINKNLLDWTAEEGKDYEFTLTMYEQIHGQFSRYISHALIYIGGYHTNNAVNGDGQTEIVPVSRKKQKEALDFVLDHVYEYPDWMLNKDVVLLNKTFTNEKINSYPTTVLRGLLSRGTVASVSNLNAICDDPYTVDEYLDDVYSFIWNKAIKNKSLNSKDKSLMYVWVHTILGELEMLPPEPVKPKRLTQEVEIGPTNMTMNSKDAVVRILAKPALFSQLLKVKTLLTGIVQKGNSKDLEYYQYLLYQIDNLLSK